MAEPSSMYERGAPHIIDMPDPNDDYPITTTEAVPDTLPPDDSSHLAPSSSTSVSSVPMAFMDKNKKVVKYPHYPQDERNNVPTLDEPIKIFPNMNSNTLCLFISGGNYIKMNEYKTFEDDCRNSISHMRKVIQEHNKIPNENIVFISPNYLKFRDTCKDRPITEDVLQILNDVMEIHKSKPFDAFFLHIVGHAPNCKGFYLREHCKINFNYLTNCVIPCFANCKLIVNIKDMCGADKFDLLSAVSNVKPEGNLHVQYSSSHYNGKSYGYISDFRLFSHCIITGFEAQECPIKSYTYTSNCRICNKYRELTHNARISYNILHEYWVKAHIIELKTMKPDEITDRDLPILELKYVDNANVYRFVI